MVSLTSSLYLYFFSICIFSWHSFANSLGITTSAQNHRLSARGHNIIARLFPLHELAPYSWYHSLSAAPLGVKIILVWFVFTDLQLLPRIRSSLHSFFIEGHPVLDILLLSIAYSARTYQSCLFLQSNHIPTGKRVLVSKLNPYNNIIVPFPLSKILASIKHLKCEIFGLEKKLPNYF